MRVGSGREGGVGLGGQGRFEQRSEVFVKIQKLKIGGGGGSQGGCEQRIEVLVKIKQVAQRATMLT